MANKFGGEWTEKKLKCVRAYLDAYAKVMKYQNFTTWYIDAFAGDGYVQLRGDAPNIFDEYADDAEASDSLLTGSALQALEVEPAFDRFEFIEKNPSRARALAERLIAADRLPGRVNPPYADDANVVLPRICENLLPDDRGVLFLDPFGMSVDWTTLCAVADTEKLDVWYLVSISAVNRMLPQTNKFPVGWEKKLTRYFGTTDWQAAFYPPASGPPTLFDDVDEPQASELSSTTKAANYRTITAFVLQRLKSIFRGGVADKPKVLLNQNGTPLFLLCFAVSNPSPAARTPALKIAKHILEMP